MRWSVVVEFFTASKDALVAVGWLVAIAGWLITNRQSNAREQRKETRTEIDAICKAAAEVLDLCRTYYGKAPTDSEDDARAAQIAFAVKRILVRTERLNKRVPHFKAAVLACGGFFDAVTQEPFASKTRKTHGPGSSVLREIDSSVHELIDKLEDGYTHAFL